MEKVPILWEKYEYQFPASSPYDGFCCIFLYYGKQIEKSMHFPFDEVHHRMGIVWGKITHIMGKVRLPISQVHPVRWILLHFPELWEIDGETLGKVHPYYGKSMSINFPDFLHTMDFVAFSHIVGNLWGNPCISHMMPLVNFFLYHTSSFMHFAFIFSEYITITSSEEALKVWEYNFLLEM